MKPSQVAIALRRIASGIQASMNPDKRLVARDLKKIIAEIAGMDMDELPFKGDSEFEEVMIGIMFDQEIGLDNAINKAKELIERDGFKTGKFMIDHHRPGTIVGNMEISPGFYDKFSDGWESEDEGVIVTLEAP